MMNEPVLYSFRRCPFAIRARLALAVSQTSYELREVHLARKPAEMLAASPKGTVPVLVLQDGTVIDESLPIMRWALAQKDPEGWLDRDDAPLIALNDGSFKHDLDRYKYPDRYGSDKAEHRERGLAFLQTLEDRLSASEHLCGASRGLVDAALVPFVRQFAAVDSDWFALQPIPRVKAWLIALTSVPLFDQIMVRVPPWSPLQPNSEESGGLPWHPGASMAATP